MVETLPPALARRLISIPRWFPDQWIKHRGGSVMISSPAKYGVDMMVANWPWPIGYSFGLVKDRVIAVEGAVQVRPTMVLTMSFDRRLMGGSTGCPVFSHSVRTYRACGTGYGFTCEHPFIGASVQWLDLATREANTCCMRQEFNISSTTMKRPPDRGGPKSECDNRCLLRCDDGP